MKEAKKIRVYEHGFLKVGSEYEGVKFEKRHLETLAVYLTQNESNAFYTLFYDKVRFKQYVGVLQVGDLTVEALPKTDNHADDKDMWCRALVEMLAISLQVTAKTTTIASIDVKKLSVLEAYLLMFLNEVERLCHNGLIQKYRRETGNKSSLKGRLLVHKQATENLVHAECFYVSCDVYDRNNIYNSILLQALQVIDGLPISPFLRSKCGTLLLNYPECKSVPISERFFSRIVYDRKTASYKTAIELARVILLNYHP
ncbi:MAG: restriction endonuclease, partial [Sphingobacteriales bacterium]